MKSYVVFVNTLPPWVNTALSILINSLSVVSPICDGFIICGDGSRFPEECMMAELFGFISKRPL